VVGLATTAAAKGTLALIISGGLIGVALSCTATSLAIRMCAGGLSGAAEHNARPCLCGRIAWYTCGAARHSGAACARAMAVWRIVFHADGGRDVACCILGRRRR